MNISTIIVALILLKANGIIVPNLAWIFILIIWGINAIIATKKKELTNKE